jgi:opacity protein-like surface antigen
MTYAGEAPKLRPSANRRSDRTVDVHQCKEKEFMKIRTAVLLAFATMAPLASGRAQISNPLKFTIFGGAALPVGDSQDALKTGYIVGGAVDLRAPLSPIGVRGELTYSAFDAKGLSGTGVSADLKDVGVNANLVYWLSNPTPVKPYLTGGPSWSHQTGTVSGGGSSTSGSENAWGFNLGGGLQFALGELGTRLDVRYRRLSKNGDSFSVIPITFGITF